MKRKVVKVKAWIMTDNKEYFHVWMSKPPGGFTDKYKRLPCTITYSFPKRRKKCKIGLGKN
mgnify:CR=1 FL=1